MSGNLPDQQTKPETEILSPPPMHNYYLQYVQLYLANKILIVQAKELQDQRIRLTEALDGQFKYDSEIQEDLESHSDFKNKRNRRAASQIQRHFRCKMHTCSKSYGSQGSLVQHMKSKHPNFSTQEVKVEIREKGQQQILKRESN